MIRSRVLIERVTIKLDTLRIENVSLQKENFILKELSFSVESGQILLILGPSGSGKTTLLRCLNRLESIDRGDIYFDGQSTRTMDVLELRRRIGMVFQIAALIPSTVKANLQAGPRFGNRILTRDECLGLMDQVGLSASYLDRDVEALSVGERQRVAFAQTLSNNPEILLLDEPTSALDHSSVLKIENLIRSINDQFGTAVILVTHNFEQALRFDAKTLILIAGRIEAYGRLRDIMNENGHTSLKQFFKSET